jgi:hypothetical protein
VIVVPDRGDDRLAHRPPTEIPPTYTDLTPALQIVAVDDSPDERPLSGPGRYPLGAAILIGVVVLVTLVVVLTLVGGVSRKNTDNGLPFTGPTGGAPSLGTLAAPPPPSATSTHPSVGKARTASPSALPSRSAATKSPTVSAADALNGTVSPIAPGSLVGPGDRCALVARVGDQVSLAECDGSAAQHWSQPGDATLRVQGGCLDVRDGPVAGTPVQVNACDGTSSQRWDPRGDGTLFNGFANRCASDSGGKVVLADCRAGTDQNWHIEP